MSCFLRRDVRSLMPLLPSTCSPPLLSVHPWYASQEGKLYEEDCKRVHAVMRKVWMAQHASKIPYLEWYHSPHGQRVKETWMSRMRQSCQVKYLDENERNDYAVYFEKVGAENKLMASQSGLSLPEAKWMCVMAPDGALYAGLKQSGRFHHSSFLAGSDVLAACEVSTDSEGVVKKFENFSGHYRPLEGSLQRMFDRLRAKGIYLPGKALVNWKFDSSCLTGWDWL